MANVLSPMASRQMIDAAKSTRNYDGKNWTARSIRSIVSRFVVVIGLAAWLLAGAPPLSAPPNAEAAVNVTCLIAAQFYYDLGDYYYSLKNYTLAGYYYRLGDSTLSRC